MSSFSVIALGLNREKRALGLGVILGARAVFLDILYIQSITIQEDFIKRAHSITNIIKG